MSTKFDLKIETADGTKIKVGDSILGAGGSCKVIAKVIGWKWVPSQGRGVAIRFEADGEIAIYMPTELVRADRGATPSEHYSNSWRVW